MPCHLNLDGLRMIFNLNRNNQMKHIRIDLPKKLDADKFRQWCSENYDGYFRVRRAKKKYNRGYFRASIKLKEDSVFVQTVIEIFENNYITMSNIDDVIEAKKWCKQNCNGPWYIEDNFNNYQNKKSFIFWFIDKHDMLGFKLTFVS